MNNKKIVIVDYKMGNLKSVYNAFRYLGEDPEIVDTAVKIRLADAIVIPGVGSFHNAMNNIKKMDIMEALNEKVLKEKVPFLGICLGMQLIADKSFEGSETAGFGWIPGEVKKIPVFPNTRLPHVGWNEIDILKDKGLFADLKGDKNFYFVHSYFFDCEEKYITSKCHYDVEVTASVQKDNIYATQFHPEKSQFSGLKIIKNFVRIVNNADEKASGNA